MAPWVTIAQLRVCVAGLSVLVPAVFIRGSKQRRSHEIEKKLDK